MKFTQQLSTHLTPEWRDQYISYEELKNILIRWVINAPDVETEIYVTQFEEEFFHLCEQELTKVNTFFSEKLSEAMRRFGALKKEINKVKTERRKSLDFKFAFSELYLSLVLLENYQILNHTGFRKILKKHDKLVHTTKGLDWFNEHVKNAPFFTNHILPRLVSEIEDIYTQQLTDGNRSKAMKRLRVPPIKETQHPWTTFTMGFCLGIFVVLLSLIFIILSNMEEISDDMKTGLRLYRSVFMMVIYLFLIGLNVFGWRKFGINHILIFEIDPRNHLTANHVVAIGAAIGVFWTLCLLGFIFHMKLDLPPFVFPLIGLLFIILFIVNPLPIFYKSARYWIMYLTGRCFAAPFFPVNFADFWWGDQLNSMVLCFADLRYFCCFYCTNGNLYTNVAPRRCGRDNFIAFLVLAFPPWIRFAQTTRRYYETRLFYPFGVNAGKYATSFLVVISYAIMLNSRDENVLSLSNPNVIFFLFTRVVQTTYCLCWDYLRDFSILQKWRGENLFLREQIIYPAVCWTHYSLIRKHSIMYRIFYYFLLIENTVIRFFWAITFILTYIQNCDRLFISTLEMLFEIIRRYLWNYVRLENEHLFNIGNFRAVRDISVKPVDLNDPVVKQLLMDVSEGSTRNINELLNIRFENDD